MIKTLNSSFIIIHKKISQQKHKTNVVVKKGIKMADMA